MTREPVTHKHKKMAERYSAQKFDALFKAWTERRNAAIAELYYTYGGVVTSEETGWSRPTVMKCVESSIKESRNARRRKGQPTP